MSPFKSVLNRLGKDGLAKDSLWMFLGYGLRIVVQAAYFILIARALGPDQYGAFVGVTALIALVAPFSGLGASHLLVKNVSRDRSLFADYWGNALFLALTTGLILVGFVMAVSRLALPPAVPMLLILLVSVADILAVRGAEMAAQAFQATNQLRFTAVLTLLPMILRLVGALVVFAVWHHGSAMLWGWFYCGASIVSGVASIILVQWKIGAPRLALKRIPAELEEGFYFGTSLSAQTVYNDIDKTMLARLSTLDATGIYAAAYRLIDVSFTPVRSVLYAAYANFFRHGKEGIAVSYSYAKKIVPKMLGYSFVVFLGLFVCAPVVPLILGKEYARSVEALRWLSLLPFFKSIHYFLADSLTGAGYQRVRTAAQIAIAIFNVLINLWLIPAYSWRGAAWSSLASDGALALTMYACVLWMMKKEARTGVNYAGQPLTNSGPLA